MLNTQLSAPSCSKLDALVSRYLETNNSKKAQTLLAQVLEHCSNRSLELGKHSSLWELKRDCEQSLDRLKQTSTTRDPQRVDTLHRELNMALKGIDNRIQLEWKCFQQAEEHALTMGDNAQTLHQKRECLLYDPRLHTIRGLLESRV